MRYPRPLLALVITAASAVTLLTACTSAGTDPGSSPSAVSVAPSTSASSPATDTPSPSMSASDPASSAPAADAVTIDITIKDHQVSPNGKKINVDKGQTVVLNVTSDADDEIHAHNGGDGYELEVKAGKSATGTFEATDTGSFEVESHHLEKVIAILVVR